MSRHTHAAVKAAVTAVLVVATTLFAVASTTTAASADAADHGSMAGRPLSAPIVAMASTVSGAGYWLLGRDGGVFSFGDARFYGSTGAMRLNQPVRSLAATPTGAGYWFVASDGGVFSFGDARFYGSTGSMRLNAPIVGMAATSTGRGYWLVAADGGIFAFGDAGFHGSTGHLRLNSPIVAMAATSTGRGYWLVAADGGIFAFGDAGFHGSTGDLRLNSPIVAMAATSSDGGYWLAGADGGVFTFGDAGYFGAGSSTGGPAVGLVSTPAGRGYWIVTAGGAVLARSAPEQAPEQAPVQAPVPVQASEPVPDVAFFDGFTYPDGVVTNEYAMWNPGSSDARVSRDWEMTSGSLLAKDGTGWSGTPDGDSPDALSLAATGSAVFRLNTRRFDFGDVDVSLRLRVERFVSTSRTPAVDWDGIHLFLRYQSEESLYYASVDRRDGTVVVKKKCPGGATNGGTYYTLGSRSGFAVPLGSWHDVAAGVTTNSDGSVTLRLWRGATLAVETTDTGVGCAPIRTPGAVGIRGDNTEFFVDDFAVTSR